MGLINLSAPTASKVCSGWAGFGACRSRSQARTNSYSGRSREIGCADDSEDELCCMWTEGKSAGAEASGSALASRGLMKRSEMRVGNRWRWTSRGAHQAETPDSGRKQVRLETRCATMICGDRCRSCTSMQASWVTVVDCLVKRASIDAALAWVLDKQRCRWFLLPPGKDASLLKCFGSRARGRAIVGLWRHNVADDEAVWPLGAGERSCR